MFAIKTIPPDAILANSCPHPWAQLNLSAVESCENCGAAIGNLETPFVWNDRIICGTCKSRMVPQNKIATQVNAPALGRPGIAVPLLISAIANLVIGIILATTCFGIIFAVPMWILCVFEFILYANVDQIHPVNLKSRATIIGICEIVVGLLNMVSLVCGIILLIHASKLSRVA